jgi:hypothetical protein
MTNALLIAKPTAGVIPEHTRRMLRPEISGTDPDLRHFGRHVFKWSAWFSML